ncbi:MAG: restriction endonuclease subunit S [Rubrivivax sp.]|nr:MAG: restriction endonuclease subunit S [Rubrivivax sp.]
MTALVTDKLPMLAAAPNGINQLRALILDLAIRGKLVEQSVKDEPADALIERISAVRLARESSRNAKAKPNHPAEIFDAGPFGVPASWRWTNLATVAQINPRNAAADDLAVSFVPMASIRAKFDSGHTQEVRRWGEVKQGFTHFAEGDIGVAKITPCFENSKACVFTSLSNGIGAGTTELHVVRPVFGTLAARYVLAYLKSPWFLKVGETRMTGTAGQKRLPKDFVESHPFPLPPIAEQHRIVAKLDELMALCDRLEAEQADAEAAHAKLVEALLVSLTQARDAADFRASWQQLSEHFHRLFTTDQSIDALKQAVMHLAVTGKLDPPRPSQDRLPNDSGHTQSVWQVKELDQLAVEIVDCPHSTPKWTLTGELCVRTSQFRPRSLDLSDCKYVSGDTYKERTSRLVPIAGDILYSREGGILGVACRVPDGVRLCLGQRMMLIRAGNQIAGEYLELVLNAPPITNLARSSTTGGAAPRVNVSTVKKYPIPFPGLADQRHIVSKANELLAMCDQLKIDLNQAHQHHEHLASVLVEQAVA